MIDPHSAQPISNFSRSEKEFSMIDTTAIDTRSRRISLRSTVMADRMYRDLAAGEISARTTHAELCTRYATISAGSDPWLDYKAAVRAYGCDHGCLVLVDDENDGRYISMMEHFGREIAPQEVSAHFAAPLYEYLEQARTADRESLPDNVIRLHRRAPARYSVYRLPFGDYSKDRQAFFDERAEFIFETYV